MDGFGVVSTAAYERHRLCSVCSDLRCQPVRSGTSAAAGIRCSRGISMGDGSNVARDAARLRAGSAPCRLHIFSLRFFGGIAYALFAVASARSNDRSTGSDSPRVRLHRGKELHHDALMGWWKTRGAERARRKDAKRERRSRRLNAAIALFTLAVAGVTLIVACIDLKDRRTSEASARPSDPQKAVILQQASLSVSGLIRPMQMTANGTDCAIAASSLNWSA